MKGQKWKGALLLILCAGLILRGLHGYIRIEEKPITIIYIPKIIDGTNEFWTALIAGVKSAAQEEQAKLQIVAPISEVEFVFE